MADRFGTSREKTYRSRNRAIAALVQSSSNVVTTDIGGLDSAAVTVLINSTSTGLDSAQVLLIAGDAGLDSAGVTALIDSDYILGKKFVSGDVERRIDIGSNEPGTQHAIGDYWLDRNNEIFYKLSASNTWSSTFPAYTYGGYANLSTFDFGSHTTTSTGSFNIASPNGPSGTFTATWKTGGTTGNNTGFQATFNNPVIFGYYYIGNSVAGWVHRVDYEDGSFAKANGNANTQATSVVWYEANGQAMTGADAKSFSIGNSGATTQDWNHPRGTKAVSLVYGRSNYGTRNYDAYLFFNGDNFYQRIGEIYDSSDIKNIIDSAYINARVNIFDSAVVTNLVDSAYIQLRDRFQEDSNFVTNIVDSAYIQARQTSGGGSGGGLDSAATLALVNTQSQQTTFTYTTTSPTTTISGNDDNGTALSYTAGNIIVFQNGILLVDSADYTATGGSSINLGVATDSGDTISITKFTAGSGTGHSQFKYVTASPQTTFSGTATHGGTLTYDVGNIQVFVNGILLVDSQDYTATDGTSVVLTQATDSNDVVAISKFSGGGSSELKGGMFRINPQSLTINTTIDSNENAHCAGPISFDSGVVLTINGNLVIS